MRLCAIAGVSRKSFYYYCNRNYQQQAEARIVEHIRRIQEQTGYGCGYRQVTMQLNRFEDVSPINNKKVYRLMQAYGLLSAVRRKKYTAEQYLRRKERDDQVPENFLRRNFFSGSPTKILCTDITYLFCLEQMWYLCLIEDLFNGEIVGWNVSNTIDTQLCLDCIDDLVQRTKPKSGIIIHSDQGSTYTSFEYQKLLIDLGFRQSCSYVGQCWENACMESFNGVFKTECLYNRFGKTRIKDRRISQKKILPLVDSWIEYYNTTRCKDYLGNLSPLEYRRANPRGTLPAIIGIN
jgi:transposase InsO family protein